MVVDRQPGTEPEGPHGLGLLSGSQMSLKPRIGSLREMGVDDGAGSGQWGNGFGEACSGCGGKGSLRTGVAVLVVKGGRRWDYYSGKRWG
ncbi:hypothetical protein V6N13_097739 [Hibiscus sabdariffa]